MITDQDIKLILTPDEAAAIIAVIKSEIERACFNSSTLSSVAAVAERIEHAPLKKLNDTVKSYARQIAQLTKKIEAGPYDRDANGWHQLKGTLMNQKKKIVAERNALRKTLFPPYHGRATA